MAEIPRPDGPDINIGENHTLSSTMRRLEWR